MAQTPPSEEAKVLVDDTIQALKSNDTSRARTHLNILNQQLPTFVNLTSIHSVKVLLDDVSLALKNNDVNNALIHLNLVKQQLTPNGGSTTISSLPLNETTPSQLVHTSLMCNQTIPLKQMMTLLLYSIIVDMTFVMMLFIILALMAVSGVIYVQDVNAASSCGHGGSHSSRCSKNDTPFVFPFP
jgi:hypothetical protein